MNPIRRVLAITSSSAGRQIALERGARLASATGAELRAQAIVYDPQHADGIFHWNEDEHAEERVARLRATMSWLEERSAELDLPDMDVQVNWAHPFDEAVMGVVGEYQPDLVVFQPRGPKAGLSSAEWRLLSQCPVPVWMTQVDPWPDSPKVVAAIDPSHSHDKPASLDQDIIAAVELICEALKSEIHLLHALGKTPGVIGMAESPEQYEKELLAIHTKRVKELVTDSLEPHVTFDFPFEEPATALTDFCNRLDADLVVMGILARSRLADFLIGSTARQFVPSCRCDVLFIKPRS